MRQFFPPALRPTVREHVAVEAMLRWWYTHGGVPVTWGDPIVNSLHEFKELERQRTEYLRGEP